MPQDYAEHRDEIPFLAKPLFAIKTRSILITVSRFDHRPEFGDRYI